MNGTELAVAVVTGLVLAHSMPLMLGLMAIVLLPLSIGYILRGLIRL